MNMMKMLKQAQELQGKAQKLQTELAAREYTSESGGGAVKVVANGEGHLISLKISPEAAKSGDAEMLEDLIVTAVREAVDKGKKEAQAEMGKLTSGLGLPGLM